MPFFNEDLTKNYIRLRKDSIVLFDAFSMLSMLVLNIKTYLLLVYFAFGRL